MLTAGSNAQPQAFRLKGTLPALTMLCLQTDDVDAIERQLVEHISQMPQFFLHAPVMLDLAALEEAPVDLARIGEMLRSHRLVPVAVRNPNDLQRERAVAAGWGVLQSSLVRPGREARPETPAGETPAPAAISMTPTPPPAGVRSPASTTIPTPASSALNSTRSSYPSLAARSCRRTSRRSTAASPHACTSTATRSSSRRSEPTASTRRGWRGEHER